MLTSGRATSAIEVADELRCCVIVGRDDVLVHLLHVTPVLPKRAATTSKEGIESTVPNGEHFRLTQSINDLREVRRPIGRPTGVAADERLAQSGRRRLRPARRLPRRGGP